MNTTFTTCAEKKAKQFLNLLQGYTKGIRMTSILILLLMGVNNAWAAKGFFGDGQWSIAYWDGSYDGWSNSYKDASNLDLGIKTTLYLKNGWVKTWSNDNWTQGEVIWYWGWTSGSTTNNWKAYKSNEKGDLTWNFDITDYDLIGNAPNNPGHNTLYMYWRLDNYVSSSTSTVTFTIPGFTTTSKSQAFDNTQVNNSSSKTISFGTHYGTALKTSNCSISGTNASEFSVTSINESGVTVQFKPTSAGDKTATLTITDVHSKTCTITLSGNAQPPTPTITITSPKEYLKHGTDKITLNITYENIPTDATYEYAVHVTDINQFLPNSSTGSAYNVISGSGSVDYATNNDIYARTTPYTVNVKLYKNKDRNTVIAQSNDLTITIEQSWAVNLKVKTDNNLNNTGGSIVTNSNVVYPTAHNKEQIEAKPNPGYAFTGWTTNREDAIFFDDASALCTNVSATIASGDAYANFTKETCVYFINTSNWSSVYAYAWNGSGNNVVKNTDWPGKKLEKTGEQIGGYDVYKYCEPYAKIVFNCGNDGCKTGDLVWEDGKYYGLEVKMSGTFNNWQDSNPFEFSQDGTSASLTLNIDAGSYEFGIKDPNWKKCDNISFSRNSNSHSMTTDCGNEKNAKFTADVTGEYTFTWTFATKTLTITYPQLVTYTVTFNMNGHGTQIEQTEVNKDSKITKPKDPTATGYTFGGWYKDVNCNTAWNFNTDGVTEDLILYAKWTINSHNVTWKANGGNWSGSTNDKVDSYNYGATITKPTDPTRTGYNFAGWSPNFIANTTMPDEALTYTAQWTINTYTITYNLNDGTGVENSTYDVTTATFNLPTPDKTGYTFVGWYDNAGLTGEPIKTITQGSTGNKTFYAKWLANKYTVKFHENGGKGEMADQGFIYDAEQALTGNAFTLENALFIGWATSEENAKNGVVAYTNGQSVNNLTTTKDGVVTLYAVWATIEITKHDEYISPNDHLKLSFTYSNIPSGYYYRVKVNAGYYQNSSQVEWITISGSGTEEFTSHVTNLPQQEPNTVLIELCDGNREKVLESNSVIVTAEPFWEVAVYKKVNNIETLVCNISPTEHIGVEITAENIAGYQFTGWSANTPHITIDNQYSTTTIIKAAAGGIVYANYKELEDKTIYLKTVEGTTDGYKWFIKYGGQEYEMTPLGCTGEYYRGEVPEDTEFQLIAKDQNGAVKETRDGLVIPNDDKNLFNLVSLAAGGNKIFFKPNQKWVDEASNKNYYFVGHFWTSSAVWKVMTDDNGDGIYECEKPNSTIAIFCLVNTTNNIENWGNDWSHRQIQTDGDNKYKQIPNGSNYFTITDDKGDQATGTWSEFADTPVNGEGEWTTFTGITYRITFNQQGATTAGTTHVDVAYHASMPEIEKLPAKNKKKFGGYYTQEDGQGVMLVNAFGEWQDANGYISSTTWEREGCVTLYAYWKDLTPEITDVTLNAEIFEPVDENKEGFVTAKPIINEHNNTTLTYVVCWKLLYTNGRKVEGYDAIDTDGNAGNEVQFSIAGLSTGTYTIRASLHTGNDCGSGEEISRFDKQFSIVANRIITVNYTCDGNTIMASTKKDAHVINETKITAPNIVGYTFKEWVAGDGVIISTADKTKKDIEFTAYYDGYLTATYTKKKMVYFYNTMGWDNVYVYFYSSDKYWDNNMGSGSDKNKEIDGTKAHWFEYRGKMEQIQGTNIWYFDYLSLGGEIEGYTNVVFNKYQQDNYEWFSNTEVVRRGDMDADKLPMFVPIKGQTPEQKNNNTTKYYNKGYWMNYPENTGYKLQIYDGTGNGAKEVASVRFPYSTNTIMPLTVSVDLEAGKTYGFKILREDNTYFSNIGTMTANSNGWSFTYGIDQNCGLKTTLAGDYTFTLKYAAPNQNTPNDYQYCVDVVYPVSVGDYRVVYTDNAQWSQTAAHGAKWYHPSYAIKKNSSATEVKKDIVSFFIAKNNSPAMKFQKCTAINGQTVTWADVENGAITPPKDKTETSVYNFIVKQPAGGASISVESVEPYTGNYYIRVDAMDGKWGNYKTNPDNRMTYSAFSESEANKFGEKFSHYATKWCEEGTNVKFTIANDYSPCISDTLIQDNGNPFNNINEHGNLTSNNGKHAANIRFMWNRKTNKISRAYVAGSTFTDRQFLILKANKEIKNSSGGSLSNAGDNHTAHQAIFSDTQNWIYERTIQVQPETRVKLYACYPEVNVANAQYFRGTYDNNNATWNDNNSVQILGGTGASWNTIRIIYDFKTNRLMAAWMPTGEIDGVKSLEADMMILREHQEDAACITFADSEDQLVNIKTVYGVLRLNKYILNNKKTTGNHEILDPKDQKSIYERALYFISFPFDVHLSDVFGFGTYGTHWVISEYNGLRRAKNGYFIDNCMNEDCTNWDYIWDPSNFTMKANQGYLLSLDLDLMKDNNESFWAHGINTVELYFPSYAHVQTIGQTSYTMPALEKEDYECKHKDHEVIDSYWRCIGVPSFADYNSALTDGTNNIIWQPKGSEFPFLYEWNVSDNSLMVQATSTYRFRPTYAYLVQNGNKIHWTAVNATPNQPSNIVARRLTADEVKNYEWKLTLSRNEQIEDQAFVRLSDDEQVTTEFDFNQDLSKEFNYGRSDIYTLIGYEKAAANSLPFSEQTTLIPLGLSIEYNGDYTIAMPDGTANIGVTLIDTESNTRTNLSAGMEYTLTLNKGDYNNRFFIEISPIQQTPTDIEYVTGDSNSQDSVRKVLIDNILYIVRDGQIFDARGARVK